MPAGEATLVGISGIDASGKGYVAARLTSKLESLGLRVAVINVDGWLNLPKVRFDTDDLPGNFYRNAIRFSEMFERLILPLKRYCSIRVDADFTDETAQEYRKYIYTFVDIDVILLDGIFLFKREYTRHFDLKIWIECSFETALRRAVKRSQEGLEPDETIAAYERIYFPAQVLHLEKDGPHVAADIIFENR